MDDTLSGSLQHLWIGPSALFRPLGRFPRVPGTEKRALHPGLVCCAPLALSSRSCANDAHERATRHGCHDRRKTSSVSVCVGPRGPGALHCRRRCAPYSHHCCWLRLSIPALLRLAAKSMGEPFCIGETASLRFGTSGPTTYSFPSTSSLLISFAGISTAKVEIGSLPFSRISPFAPRNDTFRARHSL